MKSKKKTVFNSKLKKFIRKIGLDSIKGYKFVSALGAGGTNITALYKNKKSKAVGKIFFANVGALPKKKFDKEFSNLKGHFSVQEGRPKVICKFESSDQMFFGFLMEYVSGDLLENIIPENGFGFTLEGKAICYRIMWAYHVAIRGQLMHCDLHPGNIVIELPNDKWLEQRPCSPKIKIIDFGAAISPFEFGYEETFDLDLWKDYQRRYNGSFYSLAPEFFLSNFHQHAVNPGVFDTWGLGLLLYKILTNKNIKMSESVGKYVHSIYANELQDDIYNQVDCNIKDFYFNYILKRMLSVDPGKRLGNHIVVEFFGQLYRSDMELIGKSGKELDDYVASGCDPEAHLPPHLRENSGY